MFWKTRFKKKKNLIRYCSPLSIFVFHFKETWTRFPGIYTLLHNMNQQIPNSRNGNSLYHRLVSECVIYCTFILSHSCVLGFNRPSRYGESECLQMPLQVECKWEKGKLVEEKIYKHLLRISVIRWPSVMCFLVIFLAHYHMIIMEVLLWSTFTNEELET